MLGTLAMLETLGMRAMLETPMLGQLLAWLPTLSRRDHSRQVRTETWLLMAKSTLPRAYLFPPQNPKGGC